MATLGRRARSGSTTTSARSQPGKSGRPRGGGARSLGDAALLRPGLAPRLRRRARARDARLDRRARARSSERSTRRASTSADLRDKARWWQKRASGMTTANVDPAELAKFSALAHRWWDPTSEFRPLHEINPAAPRAHRAARGRARRQARSSTWDAAAASSPRPWRAQGATVTGIDLAEKPLKVAMLHRHGDRQHASTTASSPPETSPPSRRRPSTWSPAWRCSSTCPIRRAPCAPARGS